MSKQFNKYEKKNKTKQNKKDVEYKRMKGGEGKSGYSFMSAWVKSLGTFCAGLHDGLPERARHANK